MSDEQIRFDDGAAYERFMGVWSRLAGEIFLDWLAPPPALRWLDVGCGNGAFTELIATRAAPAEIQGIDPSEGQIAFARARPLASKATFQIGEAMALPFTDGRFDAAAMGLVIFFVPDPAKGVAQMARVVRPGGLVSAYAWDMLGGGFPSEPIFAELRAMGKTPLSPPSPEASRIDALHDLWRGAALVDVETRAIEVTRSFADFDEFWAISMQGPSARPLFARLSAEAIEGLKEKVRARLPADASGRITCQARANAVKGKVAG